MDLSTHGRGAQSSSANLVSLSSNPSIESISSSASETALCVSSNRKFDNGSGVIGDGRGVKRGLLSLIQYPVVTNKAMIW